MLKESVTITQITHIIELDYCTEHGWRMANQAGLGFELTTTLSTGLTRKNI
jgi:hypothetical protein